VGPLLEIVKPFVLTKGFFYAPNNAYVVLND